MLLVATTNPGKLAEIRLSLSGFDFPVVAVSEWGDVAEPEETGRTFADNARLKADYYFNKTGLPSLADDSGLAVDALEGWPGVQSARIAPTDETRIVTLLEKLKQLNLKTDRDLGSGRFVCALCLTCRSGRLEVQGSVEGRILDQVRGRGGFGYDPIFYYPPLDRTFAELTRDEKNTVSHRARALEKLREELSGAILAEIRGPS